MAKRKQEEAPKGSPAWMSTFSDLMNLLLCFFVLLFIDFAFFLLSYIKGPARRMPGRAFRCVLISRRTGWTG